MHVFEFADRVFKRQSTASLFTLAFVGVLIVGFVDYITGYEIAVYPLYAAPILFMVWYGGRRSAFAISAICALVWWWADAADGHHYTNQWLLGWDLLMRLAFFVGVAIAGLAYKQKRDAIAARLELLERSHRLEQEIISVSERERQSIGRDLHDGVCQYLAAIGLTADLLRQNLAREGHPRAESAGEIATLLQDAVDRAREVSRGLSPVDRDEGGLESALEELASSTSRLTGITCTLISPEPLAVTDEISAIHLFRIAQEAVGNALRHGRARRITIALESSEGDLALRISDDGVGFDTTPGASSSGGMGLNIMRYRARVLAGILEIYPNSPSGTVVSCTSRHAGASAPLDSRMDEELAPTAQFAYANRPG